VENLLRLQALDLKIERCRKRETEIPKQKKKFDTQIKRLDDELAESEERVKQLQVEQRECEVDIEQLQEKTNKYNVQLNQVKKNDEYQALLHEIETEKKKISQREERIINLMVEVDEAKERLEEDRQRIETERAKINEELKAVDEELAEAVKERKELETKRKPLAEACDRAMLSQYERVRKNKKGGAAVVPLVNESVCGGCHMALRPQMINEVLADKPVTCPQCGRMVYNGESFDLSDIEAAV